MTKPVKILFRPFMYKCHTQCTVFVSEIIPEFNI